MTITTIKKQPAKKRTVPVSERALLQRINRKLDEHHEVLKVTRRGTRAEVDLGSYYILRFGGAAGRNIIQDHVDLEELGRELGVLKDYEALDEAQ